MAFCRFFTLLIRTQSAHDRHRLIVMLVSIVMYSERRSIHCLALVGSSHKQDTTLRTSSSTVVYMWRFGTMIILQFRELHILHFFSLSPSYICNRNDVIHCSIVQNHDRHGVCSRMLRAARVLTLAHVQLWTFALNKKFTPMNLTITTVSMMRKRHENQKQLQKHRRKLVFSGGRASYSNQIFA